MLALASALTGCGAGGPSDGGRALPTADAAPVDAAGNRVGPLFLGSPGGPRMCTASIVDSPGRDLLVTAAHCAAPQGITEDGLVFAPGYRNHQQPYGSWPIAKITVDPRWAPGEDEDYDVAFLTVGEVDGRRIQDVLGANQLATGLGVGLQVAVTGYPNEKDAPITCQSRTTSQSATQERFDCGGFTDGTSGSPWVTAKGQLVGVIGGYEQGGNTPQISYSVAFDDRVAELYRQATG
ncbi:trypsin-like peptidase domain-containing protein [Kitasatospora sp. NPDC049285]|uniref:trypsin-like serine peptidase n=1 Tax=Kitasatospora sp. NPDC049285 TaxID=3157096 RepID=UPI00342412A8